MLPKCSSCSWPSPARLSSSKKISCMSAALSAGARTALGLLGMNCARVKATAISAASGSAKRSNCPTGLLWRLAAGSASAAASTRAAKSGLGCSGRLARRSSIVRSSGSRESVVFMTKMSGKV